MSSFDQKLNVWQRKATTNTERLSSEISERATTAGSDYKHLNCAFLLSREDPFSRYDHVIATVAGRPT